MVLSTLALECFVENIYNNPIYKKKEKKINNESQKASWLSHFHPCLVSW